MLLKMERFPRMCHVPSQPMVNLELSKMYKIDQSLQLRVEPLHKGHFGNVLAILSLIRRCPLLGG